MNLSKGFVLTLIVTLLVLAGMLIRPFLQYILGAVLLAYVLYPLHVRLEPYVSPMVAALSLVTLAVAGVGFAATGVPNALFWTAVVIVLAMIPLIGTIPVWGGAVVYLYVTNEPLLAAGLFRYSVIIVGLTDDYLRPFAVDRYAKLNPAIIRLGILGGAYAFGVMGLLFSPVVLGALKAALRVGPNIWSQIDDGNIG